MEAFCEAEEHEHGQHAGGFERDEAVDRPAADGDDPERHEAEEQCRRGHLERVHTGRSELRLRTRSWTSATSASVSKPTTYAFGLYVAATPTQARKPASSTRNGRRTNSPRTTSRRKALRTSAHMRIAKSTKTMAGTLHAFAIHAGGKPARPAARDRATSPIVAASVAAAAAATSSVWLQSPASSIHSQKSASQPASQGSTCFTSCLFPRPAGRSTLATGPSSRRARPTSARSSAWASHPGRWRPGRP